MRRPNHASRFEGIAKNEIASFQGLRHGNLAISSHQSRQKTTLAQWVRSSSRATLYSRKRTSSDTTGMRASPDQLDDRADSIRSRSSILAPSEIADNLIGASFRINARRPRHRAAAEQASRSIIDSPLVRPPWRVRRWCRFPLAHAHRTRPAPAARVHAPLS